MAEKTQNIDGDNNTQVYIEKMLAGLGNVSSTLATLMPKIAALSDNSDITDDDTVPYDIEKKITHNDLKGCGPLIVEYHSYGTQIDTIYSEYNEGKPGSTKKLFKYFKDKYLNRRAAIISKNKGRDEMEVIRENSDDILLGIIGELVADLRSSNNLSISVEEIGPCASAVVCHAFIQCKILEKPK
ncbi:hypothetical protein BDW_13930 [Bdellovibrio bacteriovorus W]|nr:hypothetical protein BDW_13930 [Bdellovibrio bacteriovorus W]